MWPRPVATECALQLWHATPQRLPVRLAARSATKETLHYCHLRAREDAGPTTRTNTSLPEHGARASRVLMCHGPWPPRPRGARLERVSFQTFKTSTRVAPPRPDGRHRASLAALSSWRRGRQTSPNLADTHNRPWPCCCAPAPCAHRCAPRRAVTHAASPRPPLPAAATATTAPCARRALPPAAVSVLRAPAALRPPLRARYPHARRTCVGGASPYAVRRCSRGPASSRLPWAPPRG